MKKISESEYNALHPDRRGIWTTERGDLPDWPQVREQHMGKRVMTDYDQQTGATVLLVEGLSLEIVK